MKIQLTYALANKGFSVMRISSTATGIVSVDKFPGP